MLYELIADYAKEYSKGRVSDDIFKRTFDRPLSEYCIDIFKGLTIIPGLTLDSWEVIEDQSKINVEIDRKIIKEKKILNNDNIKRIVPIDGTDEDLIRATFSYVTDGVHHFTQTVEMFIPHQDIYGYYTINGRKQLPLNQIVDRSTFVKFDKRLDRDVLIFKTLRWPIKIDLPERSIETNEGWLRGYTFHLDLFNKKFQPVLYYLAELGLENTLKYFYLEDAIGISDKIRDPKNYLYHHMPCKDGEMYLTLDKKYKSIKFATDFFICLSECFIEDQSLGEIKEDRKKKKAGPLLYSNIYSKTYWRERLAYQFYTRDAKRADNVILSFRRALDESSIKNTIGIKKTHLRDTFSTIRYLMTEYVELVKKDNHHTDNKRVRNNECLVYYLDRYITHNMNSVLSSNKIKPGRIRQLLNSINHTTFYRAMSSYDIWRYERYNDFDITNLARYTFAGPAGLSGGKYKTSMKDRIIYPSHVGIFDISTSTSNPGVTGMMCINIKLQKGGSFSDHYDSSTYIKKVNKIVPTTSNLFRKSERTIRANVEVSKDGRRNFHFIKTGNEKKQETIDLFSSNNLVTQEGRLVFRKKDMYDKDNRLIFKIENENPLADIYDLDEDGRINFELTKTPEEIHAMYMRRRAKTKRRRKKKEF